MLGETFEDDRMNFISEKVRHNPVEMAYHADGHGCEIYGTSAGKTRFWGMSSYLSVSRLKLILPFPIGKSLEIIPLGTTHAKIGNDHYYWYILLHQNAPVSEFALGKGLLRSCVI